MEALAMPPDLNSTTLNVDLSHLWIGFWNLLLDPLRASRSFPPLIHFEILVANYIDRNMSHSRDALNAAAGVLHYLGQGDDPVLHLAGLPYYRGPRGAETLISLEHAIGHALGWDMEGGPCIRRPMFPSWTWASWSEISRVGWMWLVPKEQTYHLRNVQLENKSGEALELPEHIDAASAPILQRQLDTVKAIVFEAPCLPITGYTVDSHHAHIFDERVYLCGDITDHDVELMNAQQGLWSCFLLGTHVQGGAITLLCRWVDGQTAERSFCLATSLHDGLVRLFETCAEVRRVRLI